MNKFNLNEEPTGGTTVFNNGVAGKVENVSIAVEKRRADESDTYPLYKLIVTDGSGAIPLNAGFFIDESHDEKRQDMTISRIKTIAKSVVPKDFVYPEVNSYTEAGDVLFKIIKENCEGKKVNVFTSYGYTGKPSKFLGLRMFDFIESTDEQYSKLVKKPSDIMERPIQDAPKSESNETTGSEKDLW